MLYTMIDRKTAEAARRDVIAIDAQSNPSEVDRIHRDECCKVWNEFCIAETRRMAAKSAEYGQILPGIWVPLR